MNIVVTSTRRPEWAGFVAQAAREARCALSALRLDQVALEMHAISDREMCLLNRDFRGKDEPTTILSFATPGWFPYHSGKRAVGYLGELYLAPACIHRRGGTVQELIIHGILHLLGYTHGGKHDTIKMERATRHVQSRLRKRTHARTRP